jgi:hypothetical protein
MNNKLPAVDVVREVMKLTYMWHLEKNLHYKHFCVIFLSHKSIQLTFFMLFFAFFSFICFEED